MIKHLKKKIFLLDRYRKQIRFIKNITFYKHKIFLVCHALFLGGFSLRLLKEYFCSKIFETYNYKDNFDFLMVPLKNQNYLYNYKSQKSLSKNILFFFNNFNDIYLFLYRIKHLTLAPYCFYPLYFFSNKSEILLPFNFISIYFRKYKYDYYNNHFFYYIYINIIKKMIIIIIIFIFSKINTYKIS